MLLRESGGEIVSKYKYSESEAVQKPATQCLRKLGWQVEYCHDYEVLGDNGTLGRESYKDVLLERELKNAMFELNEWLCESECEQAISALKDTFTGSSLQDINESKYKMLRDGIPVKHSLPDGTTQTAHVQVFDFVHPECNSFLVAEELQVHSAYYKRRADIVGFVNGVPLLFIEFKRQDVDVAHAYMGNFTDYQKTIPQLFYYNAFIILSNGIESRVGTLGSAFEYFSEWKRLREGDAGKVNLETMLMGVCNKTTFMDLFQNFILFDHTTTPAAKILAKNHQYLGVNEAYKAFLDRKLNGGKLGVFWHTQGSGKSYSMVFLSEKIRRTTAGSPTFLILTDREELNKQISARYENCGCLAGVSASKYIANSGEDLINKLRGNPSYIFSLIEKFHSPNLKPITPDHDIIIFSDEAHRSNNGIFAENMMKLLPSAARLGFTGTPILDYDNLTARTFGNYVSVYDFADAIADGATVPIFYENRADALKIEKPTIDDELLEEIEKFDLDDDEWEKVESSLSKNLPIMMSEPRLRSIARDFVEHYTGIWGCGKAMFICVNKVTCVMMYNFVQEYWDQALTELEAQLSCASQQERMELQAKIDWMRETEMAVVVSQEQNELDKFEKWGLDILPHREKMTQRNLDIEFKDKENPFRVVFVCAMWLTGFDVKCLSTIYFDKPMKSHGLMQAIARANRVDTGKTNGLIVDYIGIVKQLREAMARYTSKKTSTQTDVVLDKSELFAQISQMVTQIKEFLRELGYDFDRLVSAEAKSFDAISEVCAAADVVLSSDDAKKRFNAMAGKLLTLYKYVSREEMESEAAVEIDAIRAVYSFLNRQRASADITDVMVATQKIVDTHIEATPATAEDKESTRFDISSIDFDVLSAEFAKTSHKNIFVNGLRVTLEASIDDAVHDNPRRAEFFERYQAIIDEYNSEQDKAKIEKTFNDLMELSRDLDNAQKEYIRQGFDNQQQQAVFEMLFKDNLTKNEIVQVKEVSRELVQKIEECLSSMSHWTQKEETRSQVQVLIRNEMWAKMPQSFSEYSLKHYTTQIFEYFYMRDVA